MVCKVTEKGSPLLLFASALEIILKYVRLDFTVLFLVLQFFVSVFYQGIEKPLR